MFIGISNQMYLERVLGEVAIGRSGDVSRDDGLHIQTQLVEATIADMPGIWRRCERDGLGRGIITDDTEIGARSANRTVPSMHPKVRLAAVSCGIGSYNNVVTLPYGNVEDGCIVGLDGDEISGHDGKAVVIDPECGVS
jgi:hypothetical protein